MYQIIESTEYWGTEFETDLIQECENFEDARAFFNNRVTAFLEGIEDDGYVEEENSHHFKYVYDDGDTYELDIFEK